MTTTLSVRIDTDKKRRLEALARRSRRSKSFLAAEAVGTGTNTGLTQLFTSSAATIAVAFNPPNRVSILARPSPPILWTLDVAPPLGQTLAVGTYEDAAIAATTTQPGVDFQGGGHVCSTSAGRFVVSDFATASDGSVSRLRVTFEQRCPNQSSPAVTGEVWFVK
jgi:hypothetical protein